MPPRVPLLSVLKHPRRSIASGLALAIAACSTPTYEPITPLSTPGAGVKTSPKPSAKPSGTASAKPSSKPSGGASPSPSPQRTPDPNLAPPRPTPTPSGMATIAPVATPTPTPSPTATPTVGVPLLTAYVPTHASVGAIVTLTGNHFGASIASNVVKFNGVTASISAASTTSLTVSVPLGATSGLLSVTVGGVTTSSSANFTVDPPPPVVSDFAPRTGSVGDSVTLTGSHFGATSQDNTVRFNGTPATITAASPTSLTVTVPNGATTGLLTVSVGGASVNAGTFTVAP